MATTITRKFGFDAGHRVLGHEGKCRHLHGHRYVAEVTIYTSDLDGLGRVIDFGEVKQVIGDWIDTNWDHNMILNREDPFVEILKKASDKEPYTMDNPTAENMARELFVWSSQLLAKLNERHGNPNALIVKRVCIWETPNCCATFEAPV